MIERTKVDDSKSYSTGIGESRLILISKEIIMESDRCFLKYGSRWVERSKIARRLGTKSQLDVAIKELRRRGVIESFFDGYDSKAFSILEVDINKLRRLVA